MIFLLDTDTIIFWLKGNKTISSNVLSVGYNNIGASIITRSELYYGAYKSQNTTQNLETVEELSEKIQFLDFNKSCQKSYAKIKVDLEKEGIPLDDFDLMIGATALTYGLTLVTNNTQHFNRIDKINVENWIS